MTSSGPEHARLGIVSILGHLAVPVGLYLAGCVACVLTGLGVLIEHGAAAAWALAGAFLAGQSMYLLDRVKLCDAWLDPADEAAQPERFAFLARHSNFIRVLVAVDAAAAMAIAALIHPMLPLAVAGLLASIVLYAGLPRTASSPEQRGRRRLKDILVIKNIAVAGGITAYSLAVAWTLAVTGSQHTPDRRAWIWAGGFVFLHVLADALLCDIDDAPSDQRFGTRTLAWRWGSGPTRCLAVFVVLVALVLTAATTPSSSPSHAEMMRWLWAMGMAASSLWLVRVPAGRMRTAVDLRLPTMAALIVAADALLSLPW